MDITCTVPHNQRAVGETASMRPTNIEPSSFPPGIFDDDLAAPSCHSIGSPSASSTVSESISAGVWNAGFDDLSASTLRLPPVSEPSMSTPLRITPLPPYSTISSDGISIQPVDGTPVSDPRGLSPRRGLTTATPHRRTTTTTAGLESDADRLCFRYKGCAVCCARCLLVATSLKFMLITVSLTGSGVVLVGISLGILNMAVGNSFLTLSLVFIGAGVITVIFVGLIWKCAPSHHEPCHKLLHINQRIAGDTASGLDELNNRTRFHRNQQWSGGIIYPEFNFGAPPPTYDASLHDRRPSHDDVIVAPLTTATGTDSRWIQATSSLDEISMPSSTPPSYRSRESSCRIRTGDVSHRMSSSVIAHDGDVWTVVTSPGGDEEMTSVVTSTRLGCRIVTSSSQPEAVSDSNGRLHREEGGGEEVGGTGSGPSGDIVYMIDETRLSEL